MFRAPWTDQGDRDNMGVGRGRRSCPARHVCLREVRHRCLVCMVETISYSPLLHTRVYSTKCIVRSSCWHHRATCIDYTIRYRRIFRTAKTCSHNSLLLILQPSYWQDGSGTRSRRVERQTAGVCKLHRGPQPTGDVRRHTQHVER